MGSVRGKKIKNLTKDITSTWKGNNVKERMRHYQLLIIGPPQSGKSCIIYRFMNNKFVEDYEPTLSDHFKKQFQIEGEEISIHLNDTSGLEEDFSLSDIDGVIFVFSVTKKQSFENVKTKYYNILKNREVKWCPFLLVGNKADEEKDREVTYEQGMAFSKRMNGQYFETSASSGQNIDRAILELVREIAFIRTGGNALIPEPPSPKKCRKASHLWNNQ